MKQRRRYRVIIEDEGRLCEVWNRRFSRIGFAAVCVAVCVVLTAVGAALVMLTPLRTFLPGYLKQSQREQTMQALMRIDSLEQSYSRTDAMARNIMEVLDTDRPANDTARLPVNTEEPDADALLPASESERSFVRMMDTRERYNLSVLSPEAAEGLRFCSVAPGSVVSAASMRSRRAEIILPVGQSVAADADGTVTDCRYSSHDGGYVIQIQHSLGFMTQYFGTGAPTVRKGERVVAGQAIAAGAGLRGGGRNRIGLEIWRNGEPLIPSSIIRSADGSERSVAY